MARLLKKFSKLLRKDPSSLRDTGYTRYVVFDFGSVLRVKTSERHQIKAALLKSLNEQLSAVCSDLILENEKQMKEALKKPHWNLVRSGEITRLEAYKRAFNSLGIIDDEYITDFVYKYDTQGKYVLPQMRNLLQELNNLDNVKCVILSNHAKELFEELKVLDLVPKYFRPEHVFISAITGHRKPNLSAYEHLLKSLGDHVRPEQLIFIDNREENATGAESAGIQSIVYTFEPDNCGIFGEGDNTVQRLRIAIHQWLNYGKMDKEQA